MSRFVAIDHDGEILVHIPCDTGNYASICGDSDDDEEENGKPAALVIGARIDCPRCISIMRVAKQYREKDVAEHLRKRPTPKPEGSAQ